MQIRRVVASESPQGLATVVSDDFVEPITASLLPGAEFYAIWGGDSIPELPDQGHKPKLRSWFPSSGGFRFVVVSLSPDAEVSTPSLDRSLALIELDEKLPGTRDILAIEPSGLHATDTVDYIVILAGEAWLDLDGAEGVLLRSGDTVVLNGARHGWRNCGSEPCVMAIALVGAMRT